MQVYESLKEYVKGAEGSVATIGNFDGVHRGHQAIIRRARSLASGEGMRLVGMTFEPAPVKVLCPEKAVRRLSPLEQKVALLAAEGLDDLVVVQSEAAFFSQSAESFAEEVLVGRLGARHVVEGASFCFGRGRSGTVSRLGRLGAGLGFSVHTVGAERVDLGGAEPVVVSSTLIRALVEGGDLEGARRCLGRYYGLAGRVGSGRGVGRQLGFPTANLELYNPDQLAPRDGVYAGWATLANDSRSFYECGAQRYWAAIVIGRSKTFVDGGWQIEAHLLDYSGGEDLRGKHILLSLAARLRGQQKFGDRRMLSDAIAADCRRVRGILAAAEAGSGSL